MDLKVLSMFSSTNVDCSSFFDSNIETKVANLVISLFSFILVPLLNLN